MSDDERREVAERLGGLTSNVYGLRKSYESEGFSILCEEQADYYQICKAVSGYLPPEHMHPCDYEELHARLADLMEPSCDRDALLVLEDEMFEDATGLALVSELEKDVDLKDLQTTIARALFGYARCIREACGEVQR